MSIHSFFSSIANGIQVLYSMFFEKTPEYAYRSSDNTTVSEPRSWTKQYSTRPATDYTASNSTTKHSDVSSDWVKISLEPILTIADVEELHNQLKQYLGRRVQLSGKNVQRIDTASLQLLLVFMLKADITVCWVDYSAQLCESARLLGISTALGLPVEIE